MSCTGGGGDISRKAMPGVPCEQCEGDSLLGLRGYAVILGGLDATTERREIGGEHTHQGSVARAASGDDVVNGRIADTREDKELVCERDAA